MTEVDMGALQRALDGLPYRLRGPGGVAGVVHEGRVIARRAWGYADLAARLPMTAATRLPICSISKQFTCAVLLDQIADPATLDAAVAQFLPQFQGVLPTVQHLSNNQSGLRDYWALTVLQGATPEQTFARTDALPLLERMKTGHFPPGTSYSYCNANFRILAELIEQATGRALGDLLAERIFAPAGMTTAALLPDTRQIVDGVVGYEGNDDMGHVPAQNGIYWIGDAGVSAALDDMLAWEGFIDQTRDDPDGLYNRLSAPPSFADGSPAFYGNGLGRMTVGGLTVTGHGGALRGFRCKRLHVAAERLSVVVMLNHQADAHGAAVSLIEAALGLPAAPRAPCPPDWAGLALDDAQGLLLRLTPGPDGLTLSYGSEESLLQVTGDDLAVGEGLRLQRSPTGHTLWREEENLTLTARPLTPVDEADGGPLAGQYWSPELDAELLITRRDGATFAGFQGLLGQGPMERMHPVATDIWVISTRRSMDAPAPGDWTAQVRRGADGAVSGITLGCWLARGITYHRRA
jgi:D-aminopeptidase